MTAERLREILKLLDLRFVHSEDRLLGSTALVMDAAAKNGDWLEKSGAMPEPT